MKAFFLLVLMAFSAFMEAISVSILVPFISLINSDVGIVSSNPLVHGLYDISGSNSYRGFLIFAAGAIFFVYLLKSFFVLFVQWAQFRFALNKKVQLSRLLMNYYLHAPYSFHIKTNSAALTLNLNTIGSITDKVWIPVLGMISEFFVSLFLMILLATAHPWLSLGALGLVGLPSLFLYFLIRRKSSIWVRALLFHGEQVYKWINQSFGGIKEIKAQCSEGFFLSRYLEHASAHGRLNQRTHLFGQMPRIFIEVVVVTAILGYVVFCLKAKDDLSQVVPTLILFAVAAMRIMPSMNRMFLNGMSLTEGTTILEHVYVTAREAFECATRIELPALSQEDRLHERIEVKKVTYCYPGTSKAAVMDVSFSIRKGQKVALVGSSGAGKTTLVDLMLGLLVPDLGEIYLDGKPMNSLKPELRRNFGYIPQNIFLLDESVVKNVAFGVPDHLIEMDRVERALAQAQLLEVARGLPKGLETFVGERGIRLSGGQRQRLGIARALYHNPEVLIMDEATSSLDQETERDVTHSIETLAPFKTIIIIAHRLSTVQNCDQIFFIQKGCLLAQGTYQELLSSNRDFATFVLG